MADRPIIYIRSSDRGPRAPGRGGPGRGRRVPTIDRQRERISPRIRELEEHFEQRAPQLSQSAAGVAPEEVIVFDLSTTVEKFVNAVRRIDGMEWLVESDEFDADIDQDFGLEDSDETTYRSRLYFVVANHEAFRQFLSLWELHQEIASGSDATWPYGRTPWRDVFSHLKDVRRWGPEDRLLDTGLIEDWQDRLRRGDDYLPVEIDLWFRGTPARQNEAGESVRGSIEESGGELVSRTVIPEIGYHGMLARLSAGSAEQLIGGEDVALVLSGSVMRLRPAGQFSGPPADEGASDQALVDAPTRSGAYAQQLQASDGALPQGSARVALLDGAPLARHALLDRRISVHDPENFDAEYGAGQRSHGTAMASIIIHGDLGNPGPALPNPLLARPIMRPDAGTFARSERIPDDVLAVDLVHRAVRELFVGSGSIDPAAPAVRLINFSIGDPSRPFDYMMTPMARLLDWLSWQHNVLFIVSAGNHSEDILLDVPPDAFRELPEAAKNGSVLTAMWKEARIRRLLSPAESTNAITVASTHEDDAVVAHPRAVPFFEADVYPSPTNALGLGYGRAVKPDVLAPGGRQPYRWSLVLPGDGNGRLSVLTGGHPPGMMVAGPGEAAGQLDATLHSRGTSNAAARVTRLGARILAALQGGETPVGETYQTVVTKCLIAHSAQWGASAEIIGSTVAPVGPRNRRRVDTARFLGFGRVSEDTAAIASDQRATLVGWGTLAKDEAELYEVPLPPSLSGTRLTRRLTITLAWLTPISPTDRRYRRAALWFEKVEPTSGSLFSARQEVDYNMARRGTLQHEIFEGEAASVFVDGDVLRLRINCREDAGGLGDARVRYGLAISIEVAEELQLPIYDEVVARIRPAVRIAAPA